MKKTQFTDALRNIKKERVSFLSIVLIAFMAVTCYVGVSSGENALIRGGNAYYDRTAFRDIEVISTLLLEEGDIEAIRGTEGVADAEGLLQTSAKACIGEEKLAVAVQSPTQRVNVPEYVAGRAPQSKGECAVEKRLADSFELAEGGVLQLGDGYGGNARYLSSGEFVITGIFTHPEHICDSVSADPIVLVTADCFDLADMEGCYMKAEVLIDKPEGTDRSRDAYLASVEEVQKMLEAEGSKLAAERGSSVSGYYQALIDENQAKLDDAAAQLADARAQLDDGAAEIEENQKKLDDAALELEEGLAELEEAEPQLADAKAVLSRSKRQLDDAEKQLADGKSLLDEKGAELADARAQLDEAERELADGKAQLEDNAKILADARAELDEAEKKLADGKAELEAASRELDSGGAQIAAGQAQLNSAAATLNTTYAQIESVKQDVRNAIKTAMQGALEAGGISTADAAAAIALIPWATVDTAPSLGDSSLDATQFKITNNIGFTLSQVDYASTVTAAMTRFDNLFADAVAALQSLGVGTAALEAAETTVRAYAQSVLDSAAAVQSTYNSSVAQLQQWNDGHAAYLAGAAQLASARAAYSYGAAQYSAGLDEYNKGLEQYEEGKARYEEGLAQYNDGLARYEEGLAQYNDGLAQYNEGKALYDEGVASYEENLKLYNDGKAKYDKGLADYRNGLAAYEKGRKAYEDGLAQYNDGLAQLKEGRELLAEKEAEYADGLARYEEGAAQLAEARSSFAELPPARWIVLNAKANSGFLQQQSSEKSLGALGSRFTTLFLVIAALVIYATVSKIVDEQHKLVGATKAFGFYNREILLKYLIYGVCATAAGVLVGSLASIGLQLYVLVAFSKIFVYETPPPLIMPDKMFVVLVAGMVIASAAVIIASKNLMRSTAMQLMQDSAPANRTGGGSGKNRLSLYQRLILRNMRSDSGRIFITIVSIIGCCALIVIGFSMRAGFSKTPDRQYSKIVHYDFDLCFDPGEDGANRKAAEDVLSQLGAEGVPAYRFYTTVGIDGGTDFAEMVVMRSEDIARLFSLKDHSSGADLTVGSDGAYAISGLARSHKAGAGTGVTLTDSRGIPSEAVIGGIYRNYAGQMMFVTPEYYEKIFGREPQPNYMMGLLNGADYDAVEKAVKTVPGFEKINRSDTMRALFEDFSLIVLALVALLTFAAGLMAGVILTNLTNIYIRQKTRELAIMRVNGFTVKETISYVLRETYITTAAGIILGCTAGFFLTKWILKAFQSPAYEFVSDPDVPAFIIGAGITILFTVLINISALRKVKDLKLTDAL